MNSLLPSTTRIIRFGLFEADLGAGELRKGGIRVRLPGRSFRILAMLLDKPGQLITRDELRNELWQDDTLVDFDHGLNNAMMRLREILCDSSGNPRFIETLHRRGYRFIAPVQEATILPQQVDAPIPPKNEQLIDTPEKLVIAESANPNRPTLQVERRSWPTRFWIAMLSIAFMAGLSVFAVPYVRAVASGRLAAGQSTSLVVLPLENLSGNRDQDYFADGMTDELIANLAKIRSLRVISRSTAMAYKGTRKSLSEIARELKVDAVVEGTVMRVGDRARITAELIQVSSDRHLWAETYESQMGDILALQNRVSSAIVNEIRITLTPEEKERLEKKPYVSPEAYENYLKGRYCWNRRSAQKLDSAIRYFELATDKDPKYALAYAALADCYSIISATIFGTTSPNEAAPKARAAARRALEIDPHLAEAETSLATVKFNYDWDWAGADAGFRKAIDLDPSYGTGYQRYSLYLTAMGRFQSSFDQINKARDLDPMSLSINFSLGWRLYMAREYDRAIQQLQNTLEMDSTYELPHWVLGQAYEQKGDYVHALTELHKAADLAHNTPLMVASLGHCYAVSGNRKEAERLLATLMAESKNQYVSPYYIAIVHAGLGRNYDAIRWLEKAFSERANGLVFLKVDPELDALRSNARFRQLQKDLKLPS